MKQVHPALAAVLLVTIAACGEESPSPTAADAVPGGRRAQLCRGERGE